MSCDLSFCSCSDMWEGERWDWGLGSQPTPGQVCRRCLLILGRGAPASLPLPRLVLPPRQNPMQAPLPSFRTLFSSLMLDETSPILFGTIRFCFTLSNWETLKNCMLEKHSKDETLKQISVSIPLLTLKAFKRSGSRLNPSFSSLASSSSSSSSSSLLPVEEASSAIKESSREWSDRPGLCKGDHLAHWRVSHKHNSRNFLFFSMF